MPNVLPGEIYTVILEPVLKQADEVLSTHVESDYKTQKVQARGSKGRLGELTRAIVDGCLP